MCVCVCVFVCLCVYVCVRVALSKTISPEFLKFNNRIKLCEKDHINGSSRA